MFRGFRVFRVFRVWSREPRAIRVPQDRGSLEGSCKDPASLGFGPT